MGTCCERSWTLDLWHFPVVVHKSSAAGRSANAGGWGQHRASTCEHVQTYRAIKFYTETSRDACFQMHPMISADDKPETATLYKPRTAGTCTRQRFPQPFTAPDWLAAQTNRSVRRRAAKLSLACLSPASLPCSPVFRSYAVWSLVRIESFALAYHFKSQSFCMIQHLHFVSYIEIQIKFRSLKPHADFTRNVKRIFSMPIAATTDIGMRIELPIKT